MFRLLPAWKGRHFSTSLPYVRSNYHWYSTNAICLQTPPNDIEDEKNEIDFELLFSSCTKTDIVKRLHALLIVSGRAQRLSHTTRLVNLYAHLGDVSLSCSTFNQIQTKDTYSWNSMLSAYVRNGQFTEAVNCVYKMLSMSDVRPDFYTFPPVLKACGRLIDGMRLHGWVFKLGFEWDVFVASALVHMYCRFGQFIVANRIFKDMPSRDMGCWNSVISGFCQNGNAAEALAILDQMRLEGIKMDSVTVSSILPVCAQMNDSLRGMLVHLYAIKHRLEVDVYVSNALINMYAKFGELESAQKVFDQMVLRDIVSWNSVIAAYEQNDLPGCAIYFFHQMQLNQLQPDLLTMVSIASSIAQTRDYVSAKSIHGYILRRCWINEDVVLGNTIVDMYAKLGIMDSARMVFDEMFVKDVVSFNTMIAGYGQNGLASEAIEIFHMMPCKNITPDEGTWVSVLPAYAHLGALREGTKAHGQVFKRGLHWDIFVGTCLVDLYGKCGRLDEALLLFYEVPRTSSVHWNAIIACHGIHGCGGTSLQLFRDMLDEGVQPDHITFLSILAACSHSGLVDQGKSYFHLMQQEYEIKPGMKHYGCMVDLYGRAGHLEKAYNFIKRMPVPPDASVWGALLNACRIHGNIELGKVASHHLFEVDSDNVGYYVLLSNIYANVGRWEGVDVVRSWARDKGLRKTPGWTSIELNNMIEVFYTGHPQSEEMYMELAILTAKAKDLGYAPDYSFVLQDVEDDEKENILTSHSERLAIAYGILNSPPKSTIRIFKNLRVCGDCHNMTKFTSKITEREIIVRDSNRFHHFKDGFCSCGDYW
nr:pentatricopeptide repeat-containing protein At4g33990-like isoform X2 [Coffea arabica]